jgi:hypothetical protein
LVWTTIFYPQIFRNDIALKTFSLSALVSIAFLSIASAADPSGAPLPPPFSENVLTFQQIAEQKTKLKDKVVRIEIARLLGDGSDLLGNGTVRYIAKDTSNSATPYGQVAFPREGLEKTGLAENRDRGPTTLYFQVHVFPEKKAAAICIAVGTQVSIADGKATYSW